MAIAQIDGKPVELAEPDDWTTRELCNAEKALGMTYDGTSVGAGMAIVMFISLKRANPEGNDVMLADRVLDMKFNVLEQADGPLEDEAPESATKNGDGDPAALRTSGTPA